MVPYQFVPVPGFSFWLTIYIQYIRHFHTIFLTCLNNWGRIRNWKTGTLKKSGVGSGIQSFRIHNTAFHDPMGTTAVVHVPLQLHNDVLHPLTPHPHGGLPSPLGRDGGRELRSPAEPGWEAGWGEAQGTAQVRHRTAALISVRRGKNKGKIFLKKGRKLAVFGILLQFFM